MIFRRIKIIIFLLFVFPSNTSLAGLENKIIVKIQNEIITNFEIKNKILTNILLSNLEFNQQNINNFKKNSLDTLINLKLKRIELSKYNVVANADEVNNYLNKISFNNIGDLKKKFKNNNIDFSIFLEEVKTEIIWRKLIFEIYNDRIDFEDKVINEEVDKILSNQSEIEEYNIAKIEILDIYNKDSKNLIDQINKSIKTIGFEKTNTKFNLNVLGSDNGKLGWINKKSLSEDILNKIKNLSIGETTEPIIKNNGVLFLKLIDKRKSKTSIMNREDLKKRLISQKKNQLFILYSNSYLSKLKNTNLIEFK
jgi:peptidyl-prolyl cis-trans isomerase SurA